MIRQGNIVFGFFLDGTARQQPVIMGCLGNNSQTEIATTIGDNRVTNTTSGKTLCVSGYSQRNIDYSGSAGSGPTKYDGNMKTEKPTNRRMKKKGQNLLSAGVNKYGLPANRLITAATTKDIDSASLNVKKEIYLKKRQMQLIKKRVQAGSCI